MGRYRKTHIRSAWGSRGPICGTSTSIYPPLSFVSDDNQDDATCAKCNPPNPPTVVLTLRSGRKIAL